MAKWKIGFAGFFAAMGVLQFFRIVSQEVQLQRNHLEIEKELADLESKRRAAQPVVTAQPVQAADLDDIAH